jgi:hypothetical protein
MKKRSAIPRKASKRNFTKHATKTHKKNINTRPMRGGIRL